MALFAVRSIAEAMLTLTPDSSDDVSSENHIFEPEYHQDVYVDACNGVAQIDGAKQVGQLPGLTFGPVRGVQPVYADDDNDPSTLMWQGMVTADGSTLSSKEASNICALKSACVRWGYIDYSLARSVTKEYADKRSKAVVLPNDVLVNSTGDGTIGRVAVFNADFPALVDGHISIIRLDDPEDAWYLAAFLLSDLGQRQIYRYINGSSGQVEVYPQDLSRIWVKPPESNRHKTKVVQQLQDAANLHRDFYKKLQAALALV